LAATTSIIGEISLYKIEHCIIEDRLSYYVHFALFINPEHGQLTAAMLLKDSGALAPHCGCRMEVFGLIFQVSPGRRVLQVLYLPVSSEKICTWLFNLLVTRVSDYCRLG
jgi:hypothetical protein